MADTEQFHWKLTCALWIVFLTGCMCLLLVTSAHKTIVIADSSYEQGGIEEQADAGGRRGALLLEEDMTEPNRIAVPLKKGGKVEDVVVENRYMQAELRIFIRNADVEIYEQQPVKGDISPIMSAQWEMQSDGILLRLRMNGIYEYQNSMAEDCLRITVCDPHDLYKMVAVIDPAGGGSEHGYSAGGCAEKEIALLVARQIQEQAANDNIRLYFTRTEDKEVSLEERAALARAVKADIYVNIGAGKDEDAARYGIAGRYNAAYFIPEFGNVQMADILTRKVTIAAKNRAVGLSDMQDGSVLERLSLPAARVEVGFLSNEAERALLMQEEYQAKLAEGVLGAIEEVYENYYE